MTWLICHYMHSLHYLLLIVMPVALPAHLLYIFGSNSRFTSPLKRGRIKTKQKPSNRQLGQKNMCVSGFSSEKKKRSGRLALSFYFNKIYIYCIFH